MDEAVSRWTTTDDVKRWQENAAGRGQSCTTGPTGVLKRVGGRCVLSDAAAAAAAAATGAPGRHVERTPVVLGRREEERAPPAIRQHSIDPAALPRPGRLERLERGSRNSRSVPPGRAGSCLRLRRLVSCPPTRRLAN